MKSVAANYGRPYIYIYVTEDKPWESEALKLRLAMSPGKQRLSLSAEFDEPWETEAVTIC